MILHHHYPQMIALPKWKYPDEKEKQNDTNAPSNSIIVETEKALLDAA